MAYRKIGTSEALLVHYQDRGIMGEPPKVKSAISGGRRDPGCTQRTFWGNSVYSVWKSAIQRSNPGGFDEVAL
jgi:hypothetical protein